MTASPFLNEILIRARRGMGKTSVSSQKPRAERVWRGLQSSGSAFVKRTTRGTVQHGKQLAGQLAYVNGKAKGTFGWATGVVAGDDAFDGDHLERLVDEWSKDWKGRPRNGHTSHVVLSFPDTVSNSAALAIAEEWCAEMFEEQMHAEDSWEYVAALHTDTENPHVHVIINNRGVDGTWFSMSRDSAFDPQMLRDRMTDIAEDFGVYLESMTRADKGLYKEPISDAEVFAAREGRILAGSSARNDIRTYVQVQDMLYTAQIYSTLADLAQTIGAPTIADRAYLSAGALFAGKEIPKGEMMDIDLTANANREDIRSSIITWTEQNADEIEAMPEPDRVDLMTKIHSALTLIEQDGQADVTEETVWAGFSEKPSTYLIHDVDAVEARAAMYVSESNADTLRDFVQEEAIETYLVTGEVEDRFKAVLPAVEEAYREMHDHDLSDIPKEMQEYVRSGVNLGLDRQEIEQRLITPESNAITNGLMERDDISAIYDRNNLNSVADANFRDTMALVELAAERSASSGIDSDDALFEGVAAGLSQAARSQDQLTRDEGLERASTELVRIAGLADDEKLTERQQEVFDTIAPTIYAEHREEMVAATNRMPDREISGAMDDDEIQQTGRTKEQVYETLVKEADAQNAALDATIGVKSIVNTTTITAVAERSAEEYRDWQASLEKVEEKIIADSVVYDREGVSRLLQDAATTAATTGRADLADSSVGRTALSAFVALEGKEAMNELSTGNTEVLADYVNTPNQERLAARELLKSAKAVDVGLDAGQIEAGLEAVDPDYSRDRGISI